MTEDIDNVILCSFERPIQEQIKASVREYGVNKTLKDLIAAFPNHEVFIRAVVKNILKRWRRGLE